jgi:hypothetical protein
MNESLPVIHEFELIGFDISDDAPGFFFSESFELIELFFILFLFLNSILHSLEVVVKLLQFDAVLHHVFSYGNLSLLLHQLVLVLSPFCI